MNTDLSADYRHLNAGTFANLVRIINHGKLENTGKFIIFDTDFVLNLPLITSFGVGEEKYDIDYYYRLSYEFGFSALMGNIAVIEGISLSHPGDLPLILRLNSGNALNPEKIAITRPMTATVRDALRVGACAVCFTVCVSSERSYEMLEDLKDIIAEAHDCGLPVVVEVLPRGGFLSRLGEGALDIIALAVRMACELGADLIKAPFPNESIENPKAKKDYEDSGLNLSDSVVRLNHVTRAAFGGKRLVGIGLADYDDDKTADEIDMLSQSDVAGLFVSSLALRTGKVAAVISSFSESIAAKAMPLFKENYDD